MESVVSVKLAGRIALLVATAGTQDSTPKALEANILPAKRSMEMCPLPRSDNIVLLDHALEVYLDEPNLGRVSHCWE